MPLSSRNWIVRGSTARAVIPALANVKRLGALWLASASAIWLVQLFF
jgi:hypothetical protein